MSVPVGYPPLESACNVHLPLHFTRNVDITPIEYPRDRIAAICDNYEHPKCLKFCGCLLYGRVGSPGKSENLDEIRYSRVIAVYLEENMPEEWRRIAGDTIQNLRDEQGEVEVPIRNWAVPDSWGIDA